MSITGREQTALSPDVDADSTAMRIRGRFKITPVEPTGAMIGWTTDLCDRCLECSCGKQQPLIDATPAGAYRTYRMLQAWFKNGLPT